MPFHIALPRLAATVASTLAALPFVVTLVAAGTPARLSGPSIHENVAVYFVHGPSAAGPVPQTLQEALAKGTVEVIETGNVQQLTIRNLGDEAVFIQSGDIVKGGQQDRVLTVSMVLEPRSGAIPIGAYCVEQGRWAARGKEDAKRFALSEALLPSREAKVAIALAGKSPASEGQPAGSSAATAQYPASAASPDLRAGATAALPPARSLTEEQVQEQRRRTQEALSQLRDAQGEVWRSVSRVQSSLSLALEAPVASERSRTSLQLALEHEKLKAAQTAYLAALEPTGLASNDIVGVVVAINGKLSSADVYPSNGLFRKMWPKLARSAATEALSGKSKPASADAGTADQAAAPAIDAVQAFLAETEAGTASERRIEGIATYAARDAAKAVRVEASSPKGALVHRSYVAK